MKTVHAFAPVVPWILLAPFLAACPTKEPSLRAPLLDALSPPPSPLPPLYLPPSYPPPSPPLPPVLYPSPSSPSPPRKYVENGKCEKPERPELRADELPGKGWHCYHWIAHYGDPEKRLWIDGNYCTRTRQDCLRKKPDSMYVNTWKRDAECARKRKRAFCYKRREFRFDDSVAIHCFLYREQCEWAQKRANCTCSTTSECKEFL